MTCSVVVPEALAASTKSRLRAWVVTVSDTRTIGGMKTTASAMIELDRPLPISPQMAMGGREDGGEWGQAATVAEPRPEGSPGLLGTEPMACGANGFEAGEDAAGIG